MSDTISRAAQDLHAAASWLAAHPSLPPTYAIHRHDSGVNLTWHVDTEAEAESLLACTHDDGWRSDHHYDDGDWSRIITGNLIANDRRLRMNVAVVRPLAEVTA